MATAFVALNIPFSAIIAAADDNLLTNYDFSAETTKSDKDSAITGWTHEENSTSQSAYVENKYATGASGSNVLTFWISGNPAFESGVYQTVENLPDGVYEFKAQIANRSITTTMYAKSGEDNEELDISTTSSSSVAYEYFTIGGIVVTDGKATVGFHASSTGGSTKEVHIDHATFVRTGDIGGGGDYDTTNLEEAINQAQAKLDAAAANIGTGVGQYSQADVNILQAAIDEAEDILNSAASQEKVDNMVTALQEVSDNFREITDQIIQEPTFNGSEWYNEAETVEINREDARTLFAPFDNQSDALANTTYSTMGNGNDNFIDLNGTWDFRLDMYSNDAESVDFYEEGYTYSTNDTFKLGEDTYVNGDWIEMEVPFAWQVAGEYAGVLNDYPIYNNQNYPWQSYGFARGYTSGGIATAPKSSSSDGDKVSPVGSFIKEIDIPADWGDKQVIISFMGVSQGMYIWVNGHCVGYGEDSFTASEFDITPYIEAGQTNTICVRVYRWTTGGFLENQDMIDTSGIVRDVYLTASPKANIKDFAIETDLVENSIDADANLNISFDLTNRHGTAVDGYKVGMSLYKEDGTVIFEDVISEDFTMMSHQESKTIELTKLVENPDKWSAEDANQYNVVLTLYDENNNAIEAVGQKVGFREISMEGAGTSDDPVLVCINGEPLYFKGVNRNETSVYNGKALTYEEMEAEVILMKQNNINSVRTSHYPQHPYMYELYNKYGIYVMDELNVETHNGRSYGIPSDDIWANSMLERAQHAVERDKNHASVVMWSLGNECGDGTNHANNAAWIRENDPSGRPIHSQAYNDIADVYSNMYPAASAVKSYSTNTKPYVICEYEHALGNSGGGLTAYIDAFESNLRSQGGWIWEWKDHSIYTLSDDGSYGFWGYGGDWLNEMSITGLSSNSNFCADGIVLADGTPSPAVTEVKAGYQDIKITVEDDAALLAGNITFRNNALFTNTNEYDLVWELYEDDTCIDSGTLSLDIDPLTTSQVENIPYTMPTDLKSNATYYLNLSFKYKDTPEWADADHVASFEQFEIPVDSPYYGIGLTDIGEFTMDENDVEIALEGTTSEGQSYEITISKITGMLTEYIVGGNTLIEKGPTPNYYRALVDNDNGTNVQSSSGYYYERSWRDVWANREDTNVNVEKINPKKVIITTDVVLPTKMDDGTLATSEVTMEYTVFGNGDVTVSQNLSPNSLATNIPVVGSYLQLPLEYSNVEYYGSGPDENYIDRDTGTSVGVYQTTTEEMFVHRSRPQETGNRTDTQWVSVTNDSGYGLLGISHDRMEFSALNYSADEITTYSYGQSTGPKHPEDMDDPTSVTLSLNLIQMGVGGETWSTGPYDEYLVTPDQDYSYTYTLRPITPATDSMASSRELVTGQPVLKDILVNGESLVGFDETVKEYTVDIEGWEDFPTIEAVVYDGVSVTLSTATSDDPRVVITCKLGEDTITYVVNINRNMDFVTAIYLDGEPLSTFDKTVRDFSVQWTDADSLPVITADAIANVTLTITQIDPETLTATIHAVSDWGDEETYTITLRIVVSNDYHRPSAWGNPIDIQTLPLGNVKYSTLSNNNYYYINNEPVSVDERGDLPFVGLYPNRRIADGSGSTGDKVMIDESTGNKIYYHQNIATSGTAAGDTYVGLETANSTNIENQTIVMYAKVRADRGPFELAFLDGAAQARNATDVFRVAFTDSGILYTGTNVTGTGTVAHSNMTTLVDSLDRDKYYEVWMVDTVNSTSMGHTCSVYIRYTNDAGEIVTAKSENISKGYFSATMQYAAFQLSSGNTTDAVSIEAFDVYVMNTTADNITYSIEGSEAVDVPTDDTPSIFSYTATAIHNTNDNIPVPSIEDESRYWEIVGSPSGVSIDQSGNVTLTKDFTGEYFEISVSNQNTSYDWIPAVYRVYIGAVPAPADKDALSAEITKAKALDSDEYTPESWELLEAALTNAISVYGNAYATQDEVDSAKQTLSDAINALVIKPVDKTALAAEIAKAEELNSNDYTSDSWAALQTALTAAKTIYSKADATQSEVDSAKQALSGAINALVIKPVDKTALAAEIAKAEELNSNDYTSDSWAALQTALDSAKATNSKLDATQSEVDSAKQALSDAIDDLVKKPVDKTPLAAEIAKAEALDSNEYTSDSWAALQTALDSAKAANGKSDATQSEVDSAKQALSDAIDDLVKKPVDKTALAAEIAKAEALDSNEYTSDSWAALQTALDAAKAINIKSDATQSEVDSAAKALGDAINSLVIKTVDKAVLGDEIANAEALDSEDYTSESWAALQTALDAAKAINIKVDATQSEVDSATKALGDAINSLVIKTVDKTALAAEIAKAEALNSEDYTSESWAALQTALDYAKAINSKEDATQEEINISAKILADAVNALELIDDNSEEPTDSKSSASTGKSSSKSSSVSKTGDTMVITSVIILLISVAAVMIVLRKRKFKKSY